MLNIIVKRNYKIEENPKKRNVDLLVYKKGKHILNIETEVKRLDWKAGEFLYDTVQLPQRKKKFCELDVNTIFVIWNKDQTAYISFKDKDVLNSPLVEVPNRYCFKGEYFYQIPIKKCKQGTKKDLILK